MRLRPFAKLVLITFCFGSLFGAYQIAKTVYPKPEVSVVEKAQPLALPEKKQVDATKIEQPVSNSTAPVQNNEQPHQIKLKIQD